MSGVIYFASRCVLRRRADFPRRLSPPFPATPPAVIFFL